jgi:quinol monooxygenase YgiN
MSIIEHATLRAKAGRGDDMSKSLPAALSVIAAAEGCLGASALRGIENPDEFVLRVRWVAVESHLEFRASPDFPRYRATFAEHLDEVVGFAHFNEI